MSDSRSRHIVGLISDTHGLLRREARAALAGVELILHAGDVGSDEILAGLAEIAPVFACYGNTDPPGMAGLTGSIVQRVGGLTIHVSHGHELGVPTPESLIAVYKEDVIVFGHTHRPLIKRIGKQLVVNPGGAGPRRFQLRPSIAVLTIDEGIAEAVIVHLES